MKTKITLSFAGLVASAAVIALLAFTTPDNPKKDGKTKTKVEKQDCKTENQKTDKNKKDCSTQKDAKPGKSDKATEPKKGSCCGHKH